MFTMTDENEWRYYRKMPVVVRVRGPITKEQNIETIEGTHHASIGDYIIRGIRGEEYPIKPDIFKETYELIDVPISCPDCGHPNHDTDRCGCGEVDEEGNLNVCGCYHE